MMKRLLSTGKDKLSHFVEKTGNLKMVNVGDKPVTHRTATAYAQIKIGKSLMETLNQNPTLTQNLYATCKAAGMLGTKQTPNLIPYCHLLPNLSNIEIEIKPKDEETLEIYHTVHTKGQTGVEMEAMVGISICSMTLYDMLKAGNPGIIVQNMHLLKKTGGKSDYHIKNKDSI